ncbi:hypothetical protein ABZ371_08040 [Streptomyces sp. NPDC005899]|uniref:hypothetical protein n=1 Tax=Streptomyces sp. NPDC005899 TaxID=3155716 RepID=UPI0033DF53EF
MTGGRGAHGRTGTGVPGRGTHGPGPGTGDPASVGRGRGRAGHDRDRARVREFLEKSGLKAVLLAYWGTTHVLTRRRRTPRPPGGESVRRKR